MPAPNLYVFIWWVFLLAISGFLLGIMLVAWMITRSLEALLYVVVLGCTTFILSINVVIRSVHVVAVWELPVDPVTLMVYQRAAWGPLLAALVVLVELFLAENNGKVSVLRRLVWWWQ